MAECFKYNLLPAAIFAGRQRYVVDTILGSCVSVCLYDIRSKIGGINHYMLPLWNGVGLASPKYGNVAIDRLMEKMIAAGAERECIVAKIFGGAKQWEGAICIGERNIEIARSILEQKHIRIVAENVGGGTGRRIWFDTYTGEVFMKYLPKHVH